MAKSRKTVRAAPSVMDALPESAIFVVTGPKNGRWRAGRKFGPAPVSIPNTDLTDDQAEAILADPQLQTSIESGDAG